MANKTQAQIEFKAVTSDFRSGIRDISKDMTTFSNELRLNATQLKGNSYDVNLLEQRQNILQQQYAASSQKVELLNQSLEQAKNILGENSNEYRNLNNELLRAQTQQQAIQNEINQTSQRLNDLRSASQEAGQEIGQLGNDTNSLSRLTTEIDQQQQELNQLKEEYKNVALEQGQSSNEAQQLASRIGQLSNDLRENQNRLHEVSSAADELDNSLNDAADGAQEAGDALENALAIEGVDELTDAFSGVAESVKDFGIEGQSSLNQVQAQLGLTNDEMGEFEQVINDIYADNFGESLSEIGENMAYVYQQTGLTGDALKVATENGYLLSDVYGVDVEESVRTVDSLMNQFGISADEAYNLLAQGCEAGLNENDELMDVISEYSPAFSDAGYSAEDMFNSIANGADTGVFTIDKLGDAFNEMNIKIMAGDADEYLKKLGFNADEFREKYAKGGDSAKQVTQEMIKRLSEVDDKQKQNNIGVGIFGTMWEDSSTEAILSLGNLDGPITNTRDKMSELNEVRYDDLNNSLENVKRIFLQNLQPAISTIVDSATSVLNLFANLPQPVQQVITVVGALGTAFVGITTVIGMVSSVIGVFTSGWSVLTGVFAAVKAGALVVTGAIGAISTPVLIVIGVITALVAAGVALYKNWDTVKAKATQIWNSVKNTISTVWNSIKSTVSNACSAVSSSVSNKFNAVKSNISNIMNAAKNIMSNVWNGIKSTVSNVCGSITSVVSNKFNAVKNTISNAINSAKNIVSNGLNKIKSFFSNCHLSLPKIKLPHFSVSGKLSINPPKISVPKINVSWYKYGGIMTQPTIFGTYGNTLLGGGEAGQPEAILPLDNFYNYLDSKLQQQDGIVDEIRKLSNKVSNLSSTVSGMELKLDIDGREFTRTAVAPNQDELDDYNTTRNMKLKY